MLQEMGFNLFATKGTARALAEHQSGVECTILTKPSEESSDAAAKSTKSAVWMVQEGQIDLVINITDSFRQQNVSDGYQIRRASVDFGVSLISNLRCAELFVKSLHACRLRDAASAAGVPGSSPRSASIEVSRAAADPGDPHFHPMHILEYYRTNAFAMDDYA
jgi:hypothetical protein